MVRLIGCVSSCCALLARQIDMKTSRVFLKRCKQEQVRSADLYLGSTVNVLSRQLSFVDYGDDYTRSKMGSQNERTLGMIKPAAMTNVGPIIDGVCQSDLLISKMRMCHLTREKAREFYREHEGKPFMGTLLEVMSSGPIVAMELIGADAVNAWRRVIGPTAPDRARAEAPTSIRARFGTDTTNNAVHGSDAANTARRELDFFFHHGGVPGTARLDGRTACLVIKPHAVLAGLTGKIMTSLAEMGFEVSAIGMHYLDKATAEEFLEVYKGVLSEYTSLVDEMTSGPSVALEVAGSTDVQQQLREACGPMDPEIARRLRPRTLRALYGKDKIKNAMHCTDLPEDAQLEVQYFFQILDS